ncbi:MAG: cytoplasmic protein [Deltaproteobacteria bacterium]|nr:cytoplasmic protein [Deltaproteobacteria bacterium]
MTTHHHRFVEEYDGPVGFGFDRKVDECTLVYYLQKFSDDDHMAVMRERMSEADMEELFDLLSRFLKTYLSEAEYHQYFLKDDG